MPVITVQAVKLADALPVRLAGLRPSELLDTVRVENDEAGLHFGAFRDGALVSVASLFIVESKAQLRKFSTLPAHQGQGVGAQLLAQLIEHARRLNATEFWCNARVTALTIYLRSGMLPDGATYEKDGRLYQRMSLKL